MGLAEAIRGTTATKLAETEQQLQAERWTAEMLAESLAQLEHALYEPGWQRLTVEADLEFSRDGLDQITALCEVMRLKNPLIRRGVNIRVYYVWGQGVTVDAREPAVAEVVSKMWDLDDNQRTLFSMEAAQGKERQLSTDGNLFLAPFTDPTSGAVHIRSIPFREIRDVIRNPNDRSEPWYYQRARTREVFDLDTGISEHRVETVYHPALDYLPPPGERRQMIGRYPVEWNAPLLHVQSEVDDRRKWSIPDVYAAVDWAMAYKLFLEDWATLVRSLSRFAWKKKSTSPRQLPAHRAAIEGQADRNAGATALMVGDDDLTPIPKTGATVDAESGRPLALMVASAMDVPETLLRGNADVGNLATARTLDRPTELAMRTRQGLWTGVYHRLANYAVMQAARTGMLSGAGVTLVRGPNGVRERVVTDLDLTVDVEWPSILEHDVKALVEAIEKANGTGEIPPDVTTRLLLTALGVDDVDELVEEMEGIRAEREAQEQQQAEREMARQDAELEMIRNRQDTTPVQRAAGAQESLFDLFEALDAS